MVHAIALADVEIGPFEPQRDGQFLAHPLGLQSGWADQDNKGGGSLSGSLHLRPEEIPSPQPPRIDPHRLPQIRQGPLQLPNHGIIDYPLPPLNGGDLFSLAWAPHPRRRRNTASNFSIVSGNGASKLSRSPLIG